MTHRPLIGVTAFLHLIDDTFEAQICGNRTPQAVAEVAGGLPGTAETAELLGRHCQRKVDYFARTPNWHFAAFDIPRFFRIDPSGSTATSSI